MQSDVHRPGATPDVAPGWRRAFRDLAREHGFEPLRLEGVLPAGLRGTLYRNGPALFSNQGEGYGHWFDGDGAVTAVRFDERGAAGAIRLVQSAGLRAERAARRPLTNNYGTRAPGLRGLFAAPKNTANTSVLLWQGRLLALQEGNLPTELSPGELRTLGETDLDGAVAATFSAHPHYVPERRATYNFGVRYGRVTRLDLYELPEAGPARRLATLPLGGSTMIHDFLATARHLVFFAPPLRLRLLPLLLGQASYSDALAWRPELGTEVIVVPLDAPARPRRYTVDPFFQWHFANAYDDHDDIVVDLVRYPDFETHRWLKALLSGPPGFAARGCYGRAVLTPSAGRLRFEARFGGSCEFPRVAPGATGHANRFVYLVAHRSPESSREGLPTDLLKLDLRRNHATRMSPGAGQYPSEPVFVPRPDAVDEDDGWLLTLVYDAGTDASHVAVLDARDLARPVLARACFPHPIPHTFHGAWQPEAR